RMNIDKSPGPDGIYPRILWEAREEIAEPLAWIFMSSLSTGIVPEDWRIANVVPLFKKGSRDSPSNYRPVSLTSVVGKVLERMVRDKIYEHLGRNNVIRDSQHGFVKGRSCLTNLIEFFEKVTKEVDEGKAVDVVYMDFSKAFDKVPHGRLMLKLRRYGIEDTLEVWIRNWLAGRRQRVVVDGLCSSWSAVTSGVPQGSVLGPLLFVIFINDLEEGLESWVSKFADDTKVGGVVDSEEGSGRLQRDIDKLQSWAEMWQMEFNVAKCEVVHFGRNNKMMDYWANGRLLGSVDEQRDLGVHVHRSLKVATQVNSAVRKAYGVLGFIGRGIEFRSPEVMLQLYKTLRQQQLEGQELGPGGQLEAVFHNLKKIFLHGHRSGIIDVHLLKSAIIITNGRILLSLTATAVNPQVLLSLTGTAFTPQVLLSLTGTAFTPQVLVSLTGTAVIHRFCCHSQALLSFTGTAYTHRYCVHSQVLLSLTGTAVTHRYCCHSQVLRTLTGTAVTPQVLLSLTGIAVTLQVLLSLTGTAYTHSTAVTPQVLLSLHRYCCHSTGTAVTPRAWVRITRLSSREEVKSTNYVRVLNQLYNSQMVDSESQQYGPVDYSSGQSGVEQNRSTQELKSCMNDCMLKNITGEL
ncbi:uncharacterized protein LOC132835701, partial [Hemiscyllium ocellatum]|uniref:uncharacterized protein LOC132835701 n=1 Tax=Hemiscyllium ocellatum TaxID=170820 RepID=UPI002966CA2B